MINPNNTLMLTTISLCLILIVIVIIMIVVTSLGGILRMPPDPHGSRLDRPMPHGERDARGRVAASVGTGVVVTAIFIAAHAMRPDWFALPLALAPSCAAAAFIAMLAFWPDPDQAGHVSTGIRTASLRPRTPSRYVSRALIAMPVLAGLLLVAYLCVTSALASPDEYDGLYRTIRLEHADYVSAAGPYPGSYYAVPMIAATVMLTTITIVALFHIAHAPASHDPWNAAADAFNRTLMMRIMTFVSAGATMCCAAGVSLFAGIATRNVGVTGPDPAYWDDVYPTAGMLQIGCGIVCGVIALAMLSYASLAIIRVCIGMRRAGSDVWHRTSRAGEEGYHAA